MLHLAPPTGTNTTARITISAYDNATYPLSSTVQYDLQVGGALLPPNAPTISTVTAGNNQLSVVFAAGRIEVAWEPTAPEAPAMASIGPLLQQRRFSEARPLLETLLQLEPEHPEALYNLGELWDKGSNPERAREAPWGGRTNGQTTKSPCLAAGAGGRDGAL